MKNLFFLLILAITQSSFSQVANLELLGSGGDKFTSNDLEMTFSLGEFSTETYITSELQLSQGFHQVFFVATPIENIQDEGVVIKIYPNPFSDYIGVEISNATSNGIPTDYLVTVTDLQGRKLMIKNVNKNFLNINSSALSLGIYLLTVQIDGQQSQTYKIVKQIFNPL